MTFTHSSKRSLRRQQKAFTAAAFSRLPADIQALIQSLQFEVVFKAWNGRATTCIYHPAEKRVYIPPSYWKDQTMVAKWMKLANQAVFIHELFHAVDMEYLDYDRRAHLLEVFTGYAANASTTFYGHLVPKAVDGAGQTLAEWTDRDWAQSSAELFADTGVEAFTDLPPHDRAPEALKVTEEAKAAVIAVLRS